MALYSRRLIPLFASATILAAAWPAFSYACGWWGDGEVNRQEDPLFSNIDGRPLPQGLSLANAKLPGRMGYGVAVPNPGRAIPYLQTTHGQPINRITELRSFGFDTVIDLGTPAQAARKHRKETEALGMHYFNIPITGTLPSSDQVERFTQMVVDASGGMLLVYAPSAELLGSMWAAHRINLGGPLEFSLNEGRKLGMGTEEERGLRDRLVLDSGDSGD